MERNFQRFMKSKKILRSMLLALSLLLMMQFVACNPTTDEPQQSADQTTAPEVTTDTNDTTADTDAETTTDGSSEETTAPEETPLGVATKPSINFDKTVQVSESNGAASVTTASGLAYTAAGYSAYSGGMFTINADYTVALDSRFVDAFNRLMLCYVSDAPLKCTVTYVQNGKTVNDLFYLEAGTQTFCGLTLGYLSGKQASELTAISFSTCEEKNASFVLCDVKTEDYKVYADEVYYVQNDQYELGVRLSWGGGICHLVDKNNTIKGLTNLVNQADTGRLVQQSYYGTYSNGEYVQGHYNNATWPYNPVQGGDCKNNPSRIIDVVVGESSLYIKAQPQDWSKDGEITPSYMENTYILENNYIRVDNRFVDFSGWEHRYANQELPAFYTVSYLDKFTYYGGSTPWQNDALSERDDLNFWGDPKYNADCTFRIRESNTETWCAWTNSRKDYGFGLYVPNVDIFLAGRHAFNNSKDAKNGATNYVAPLNTLKLVSYEPLEYSYMMTTGTVEQIRATFLANKDFATNEALRKNYVSERIPDMPQGDTPTDTAEDFSLVFNNTDSIVSLRATSNTEVTFDAEQSAAVLKAQAAVDPHVTIDYLKIKPYMQAKGYSKIVLVYMIPVTNGQASYNCSLFLSTGASMYAEGGKSVTVEVTADGEYHTIEIDVVGLSFWSGDINRVRLDYFEGCSVDDVMYLKSITLTN